MSVDYIDSVKKIVGEYTFKHGVEFCYESYLSVRVIYVYFEKAPYHAFAVRVDENGDVEINTPGSMANGEVFEWSEELLRHRVYGASVLDSIALWCFLPPGFSPGVSLCLESHLFGLT